MDDWVSWGFLSHSLKCTYFYFIDAFYAKNCSEKQNANGLG